MLSLSEYKFTFLMSQGEDHKGCDIQYFMRVETFFPIWIPYNETILAILLLGHWCKFKGHICWKNAEISILDLGGILIVTDYFHCL